MFNIKKQGGMLSEIKGTSMWGKGQHARHRKNTLALGIRELNQKQGHAMLDVSARGDRFEGLNFERSEKKTAGG